MSLPTPTTQEVSDTIVAQLATSLGQSIPILPKSFIRVLAKVLGGVVILLYKYASFVFLQVFVAYATDQETTINGRTIRPLVEWGRLIGVGDPRPSVQAQHTILVTVTNQVGILSGGSSLIRPDTGIIYQVVGDRPLNAPTIEVTIRAVSDPSGGDGSGAIGNLQLADIVEFANPLPNVQTKASVIGQLVAGADAEQTEVYRSRIVSRFQSAPQGGAAADYRSWAEDVLGVINVYPYAGIPGTVDVFIEASPETCGNDDGIPTAAQLDAVGDAINLDIAGVASRRPINAAVTPRPIIRAAFDIRVISLVVDQEVTTKTAIHNGVDEYFRTLEPYIVGLSTLPRKDRVTQASVAAVVNDIVSSAGGTVTSVVLMEAGAPIASRSLAHGEKAKLGDDTYI